MTLSISSRSRTAPGTIRTLVARPNALRVWVYPVHWAVLLRIEQQQDPSNTWGNILKDFEPFAPHGVLVGREPGDIASGMRKARNKASFDRVGNLDEHDWYRARHPLHSRCDHSAENQYHVWIGADEFRCMPLDEFGVSIAQSDVDPEVLALIPARIPSAPVAWP